ncbi:MAG: hypothetical protein ACUVT6_10310 [Thermodesulfobacteriota bacterium]
MDELRDGFWIVYKKDNVEGSIVIDKIKVETEGAHLRWGGKSKETKARALSLTPSLDFY